MNARHYLTNKQDDDRSNPHLEKKLLSLVLIGVLFLILVPYVLAPPSPHNVAGRVLNNHTQGSVPTGVPNGITVFINNSITGDLVYTQTFAPPFPQLLGSYSATINGEDGNLIVVRSWNATHWGEARINLAPTTTHVNVTLNQTRGSEANITILLPLNNSIRNTSVAFNVTANITIFAANGTNCNATLVFSPQRISNITSDQNLTNQLGNIPKGNWTTTTWNVSGLADGILNISVHVACSSDEAYLERLNSKTHFLTIKDTTLPVVNLSTPLNASWVTRNITFNYNVTENTGLQNCSLYIDGQLNQTSPLVPVSSSLNFTLNNTPEGEHSWFVGCVDNGTFFLEGNSTPRTIFVDGTKPNVTLLFPSNNSVIESYRLLFSYNVSDNYNATNCTLFLNGQERQTNYSITLNQSNNFSIVTSGGDYNWSVNCSDNAANTFASAYHRLLAADLELNLTHIPSFPIAKEVFWINATVHNRGSANHTANTSVLFYEHNVFFGIDLLLANFSINVSAGHNTTVNVSYEVHTGDFFIIVEVDDPATSNGSIVEQYENNNKLNRSVSVPPHHIFYGDLVADIILATASSTTVFNWLNATSTGGNLYAADTDSTVSFNSLRPLGRNVSYNLTFDDFAELDLALNSTNLSTSINRTYTSEGWANNTLNFTLFSHFITDVPVVNSTNTSAFPTGILWDYSDSVNGNYTGIEDVVFVTTFNRRQVGTYGTYDYELRLPAKLESYVDPNLQNSVSFYREIT